MAVGLGILGGEVEGKWKITISLITQQHAIQTQHALYPCRYKAESGANASLGFFFSLCLFGNFVAPNIHQDGCSDAAVAVFCIFGY